MARSIHSVERGLRITDKDSKTGIEIIQGSAAPGGDSAEQDAAPEGSLYVRRNGGSSTLYQKIASANATSDWQENGSSAAVVGLWRPEKVRALTNDTQGVGTRDMAASPFSDDEGTQLGASDFTVGEYLISDADGTPALLEVTVVSGDDVTFAAAGSALTANDTFVVCHYLPDSPDNQENAAIANFNGTIMVKLSDIDWNFADGINMAAAYAAQNGTISSADTVNSAIQKLEGNQQDIQTSSGLAQGDVDYGTFTGDLLADNQTSKQLFQAIETELETGGQSSSTNVTTITAVDTVLVDEVAAVKWYVYTRENGSPANVQAYEVFATHDGTLANDATDGDSTVYSTLCMGTPFDLDIDVEVSGTGAAQVLQLNITSTDGADVRVKREEVKF